MLDRVNRVRGLRLLLLTVTSLAYGALIVAILPFWRRMEVAQGGRELQTIFFYGDDQARSALGAIDAAARSDAFAFYAVDVPNALLFGLSLAALTAFGLRLLGAFATHLRWLILLPLISGTADLVENAILAAALALRPDDAGLLGSLAGVATGIKLCTGYASILLMLALAAAGLAWSLWRRLR